MIVCKVCGTHNNDDDVFCGNCGAFLEWEGERVDADTSPISEQEPVEEEYEEAGGGGIAAKVKELVDRRSVPDKADPAVDEPLIHEDADVAGVDVAEEADEDLRSVVAAQAEAEALAAEEALRVAENQARADAEAAERARADAEAAERARHESEEKARQEAEEAERLRARLEEAEQARAEAEARLSEERSKAEQVEAEARAAVDGAAAEQSAAAEQLRREAEEAIRAEREAAERASAEAEEALRREREAAQRALKEAEEAERARQEAIAEVEAERRAAEEARAAAEQAEHARLEAEKQARDQAEAAEKARRAAALVAKPVQPSAKAAKALSDTTMPTPVKPKKGVKKAAKKVAATPRQPEAVRPGKQKAKPRRTSTAPVQKYRPGDLICGNCGTGNNPERKFCRRCGTSLDEAEAARGGFFSRLAGVFRRKPKVVEAGTRPGRRGGLRDAGKKGRAAKRKVSRAWFKTMRTIVVAGALLAAVGISVSPMRADVTGWVGERFASIRQFIAPQFEPVHASSTRASSERDAHPARHATDLLNTTWWAAAAGGAGERLFVEFDDPVDIAKVGFLSGAADEQQFLAQPRPRDVHLVFSNGATLSLRLLDQHEFQVYDVSGAEDVTSVEIQIHSVYPGQSGQDLSITEIEFRSRQ